LFSLILFNFWFFSWFFHWTSAFFQLNCWCHARKPKKF
jgi:hypothetical protein